MQRHCIFVRLIIYIYLGFILAATPKPLSRSASPHIPNSSFGNAGNAGTTSMAQVANSTVVKQDLSESSSDSSSSGR
jgi:hypothetical protein